MLHESAHPSRPLAVILLVTVVVLPAVLLLLAHTPPARGLALRAAIRMAAGAGVRLEAARLDYNLVTLRVGLVGVRVGALEDEEPFFRADAVQAALSRRIFGGVVSFEEVVVRGGAVRIVRRRDGTTNLPRTGGPSQGEPAPLPVSRLVASGLAVDYLDEQQDVRLRIPSVTLELSSRGRLALDVPAEFAVGSNGTRIEALSGDAAFDGRDLRLSGLRVALPEASAEIDGTLALMRREQGADLRLRADADLERAAKWWGQSAAPPRGRVAVTGVVRGPFSDLSAELEVRSAAVTIAQVTLVQASARARIDGDAVSVSDLTLGLAGGQVSGSGSLRWADTQARVDAAWRDVTAEQLAQVFGAGPLLPTGRGSGQLMGSGSLDDLEAWRVDARLAMTGGRVARGRVSLPGETQLLIADRRWTLDARHAIGSTVPVTVSLSGGVVLPGLSRAPIRGTARVPPTEIAAIAQLISDAGLGAVPGDLASGPVRADLEVSGTIGRPAVQVDATGDAVDVFGQSIVNLRAVGQLSGSSFTLDELSADQAFRAGSGNGHLRASGRYDLARESYAGEVTVAAWRLDGSDEVPVSAQVTLDYSGEGRGRLAYGKGRIAFGEVVWEERDFGRVEGTFELDGETARLDARAPDFGVVAQATVQTAAPYETTARISSPSLDLGEAIARAGLSIPARGTAAVRVDASGPLERWRDGRAVLIVDTLDGRFDRLPVSLREPAQARYDSGRVAIDRLEVSAGQTYLSAAGDLPLENRAALSSVEESLVFSLTGDLLDVAQAAALASAARGSERVIAGGTGPLVLVARVAGSVASPAVTAALDIGPATVEVRPDLPAVEALRVRATLDGGEIDLSEVSGTYQGARLTAQGQGPLALFTGGTPGGGGEATLRATASGITSAILKPFVGAGVADEIAGGLDARLELSTPSLTLEGLHGDLVLDRLDVSVASLPIRQRVPTRVVVRDGLARVEAWDWAGANGSLTVQGQVNLADRLVSLLADGQLDARLLTPFLRDAGLTTAGRVRTRLSVSGALADPTLNGDLQLSDGELRLAAPRVVASDVDARATLARGRLYVSSLSGSVNGGRLSGSGRVQYAPTLDVRLTTTVEGMALEFPAGLRSELDTSLQLSATAVAEQPATATLTGEVTIRRGAYREPLSLVTGVLANLRRSTTAPGTVAGPSALEWLTLDVRVVTDEDLVVQNNVARAQLGADLRVINSAAAPSLSGRAELREGGQLYLGRNVYTVQSGTIDFANPTTIEPILGIEASTKVSGVDIDIQLSGPPDTLTTALSSPSDPELGQSDLASLLLTGRRLENTDAGQAAAVGAQLAGSVAGDVLGLAGRAIGFDTVRVGAVETTSSRDPAELASQTDPTSRLTFGKSFGSNLDVTLSQSLVDSGAQTWIIDYLPVRRVALRFVSDDDELRSYEFRHEIVFGAPSSIRSGEASREAPLLRVSSVRFTGEPGFPEPELRAQLQLREQDRFDFISWQDDRDRLERFYHGQHRLTATIRAGRRVTPAGVDLTYEIAAGPETRVRVSGAQLDRRALEEIETAWARAVLDAFVVDEVQAIVRRALAQAGDYEASVRVCLADAEAIRTLVVDVVPGTRVERVDVRLEGVTDALRGELTSARDAPAAAIAMEAPDRYAQQLEDALRQRGYLRASVSVTRPSMEGAAAVVPVTVDPGRQYHVGVVDVRVGGPSEDVRAEAGLTTGDVYRDTEVESARTRLQGQYRQEGYVTAAVDVERLVREDEGLVDVTYVVREGPRQTIAEVTVAGNVSVDEDVVLSALRLKVGQALKAADWLQARRRLFESGLFRRVDIGVEPLGGALDSAPVRLRVVVEEWPALRLRYGLQVAQERPEDESGGTELEPGFSADVTRRTLFGRAITIGAAGQYQKRERVARIFLSTPSLFGWPVRSSVTLERSREEPAGLDSIFDKTIASWEQRIRTGPTGVSYGMRFERNLTRETNPPIGLPAYEVTAHIGLLTVGLASDTRDDPADATRGLFVTSTLEQAPSALGSDYPFVRSLSQVYRFQSWKGVVLASTARYGVMRALGGGVVFPSQQFRAGGARTVRGVPEDGLGIGTSMLIFNQETRFPIYRWVRGVGFFDAGNVFAEPADLSLGQLVGSVGVGLRVVTPFVLLRVDYGRTIWNRPFEDSGRWVFGIGQAF